MSLDARAKRNLVGVHPDLVRVVKRASDGSPQAFTITEGLRSLERQRILKRAGKSQTLKSRHITGHAVDVMALVAPGSDEWEYSLYTTIAKAIKAAAKAEGVPIEWGGDWPRFKDAVHFQLPWAQYPK